MIINDHAPARQAQIRRAVRLFVLHLLALLGRLCIRPCSSSVEPQRILVIKPDHLGDVLLATPALRRLRQQHPAAQIVALVGPWAAVMLQHNPDIDALLTLPFPGFDRAQATTGNRRPFNLTPYTELLRYAALIRAGRFDTVLLLRDDHWWGALLALYAGIPQRIGYAVPECRPLLTTALDWQPAEHVTTQALALVHQVGAAQFSSPISHLPSPISHLPSPISYPPGLRFEPAAADMDWTTDWLAHHGITSDERLVVIHPGTGGFAKLWLSEHWSHVAAALGDLSNVRLLLTGGLGEESLVEQIATTLQRPPLTLVGAANVTQLAALLQRAALVLGVDSGPLHIAVSQGTPTVHLFGPSDQVRFGPWGDPARHVVLRTGLWCSPCGVFRACPRHTDPPECMATLTVDAVIQVAQRLLQAEEREGRERF